MDIGFIRNGGNLKMTEGKKFDENKNRYDLLPFEGINEIAKIFTFGAAKYGDRNWEQGIQWSRIFGAIQRHLWAFWNDEGIDPESGLPHLAHAGCNIMMLLHYSKFNLDCDDRPATKIKEEVDKELRNLSYDRYTIGELKTTIQKKIMERKND